MEKPREGFVGWAKARLRRAHHFNRGRCYQWWARYALPWVVTHDITHWKGEIAWMSLYFQRRGLGSLALCAFYSLDDHLPRYRTEAATVVSWSSVADWSSPLQSMASHVR